MRRWAPCAVLYLLSAALVIPATPLAASDAPSPLADPSAPPADPPSPTADSSGVAADASSPTIDSSAPAADPSSSTADEDASGVPVPAEPESSSPSAAPSPSPALRATPTDASAAPAPTTKTDRRRSDRLLARAAAPGAVTIVDFSFGPATLTVDVGDSVTWTNQDDVVHTATSSAGGFDTGDIEPGTSASATFDQAGSFSYICKPHPFMKGTVVVGAASSGGGGDAPTDDGASTGTSGAGTSGAGGSTSSGAPAAVSDAADGPSLPNTGLDALLLAGLGAFFLALGALLNRRTAEPPPPGRAGW